MANIGSQPTPRAFGQACQSPGVQQAFTRYNNPKGNADTERLMRTLKGEFIWLHERKSPVSFIEKLDVWVEPYNNGYLLSRLVYKTSMQYECEYQTRHSTPLAAF